LGTELTPVCFLPLARLFRSSDLIVCRCFFSGGEELSGTLDLVEEVRSEEKQVKMKEDALSLFGCCVRSEKLATTRRAFRHTQRAGGECPFPMQLLPVSSAFATLPTCGDRHDRGE
jgi:hypothetical protein